jgi:hypothetical protein
MPAEAVFFVTLVVVAFVALGLALAWAQRQTAR